MSQSVENSTRQDKILYGETRKLNNAIDGAVTFLLEARNPQGWWMDYNLGDFGFSDEWVTAYVGTTLAKVPYAHVSEDVMNTWKLLKTSCRSTGGWGYNTTNPGDASSTGWVLQLAEAVDAYNSEQAQQAKGFVTAHIQPNGGIAAYAKDKTVRDFFKVPPQISTEGYCQAHVCVSAEVAALPEFRLRLQDYLKATQTSQGNWLCYWWHDHEYATALAAEALVACGQAANQSSIDQAVAWGVQRLTPQGFVATSDLPDGSPFATALCLRLLLLDTVDPEVKAARSAATQWLAEQQRTNGAWIPSALLRFPYPNDRDPNQFTQWVYNDLSNRKRGKIAGSVCFDENSIFTTATVLYSLQKAAELIEK